MKFGSIKLHYVFLPFQWVVGVEVIGCRRRRGQGRRSHGHSQSKFGLVNQASLWRWMVLRWVRLRLLMGLSERCQAELGPGTCDLSPVVLLGASISVALKHTKTWLYILLLMIFPVSAADSGRQRGGEEPRNPCPGAQSGYGECDGPTNLRYLLTPWGWSHDSVPEYDCQWSNSYLCYQGKYFKNYLCA